MPCYLVVFNWKCGMVCCAGNVVWCENCWAVVVRCGIYITSHLITSFHYILHCIIPHQTPFLTLFQTTPHSTSDHHSSPYHISYHTNTSIPFCNTIFQIALYRPHYAAHHMSHCTPFHITYHVRPHSMYSTAHFRSHHILAILCIAPPHLTSHHIFKTQRCTEFHMPLHILHKCIIPPHLTVITPNSTSHYHVLHNIPHQYTTTFYIPPLTTSVAVTLVMTVAGTVRGCHSDNDDGCGRYSQRSSLGSDDGDGCGRYSQRVSTVLTLTLGHSYGWAWLRRVNDEVRRGRNFTCTGKWQSTLKLLIRDPPWPSWLRMVHVMVTMMVVVMVTSIFMIRPVVVMIRPAWWSR